MYTSESKTTDTSALSSGNTKGKAPFFQPKLTINEPGDKYEQEADSMADHVMRMAINDQAFFKPNSYSISQVQRKCQHCEDEEKLHRKESSSENTNVSGEVASYISSLSSKGSPLPETSRSFFEPRFGQDFSGVRIHNDAESAKSSQAVNALAYTVGNNIVFNQHQFSPESDSGKRLLAHELTHVVQQQSISGQQAQRKPFIQRIVHHGTDHAGSYDIDTDACTFNYQEDWYFNFVDNTPETRKNSYMASAERQVERVWSHKFPISTDNASCPCHDHGFDVNVDLTTQAAPRNGRHGYSVDVNSEGTTGLTNQPNRHVTLDTTHESPVDMGSGITQQRIAHEFGHTLGITDEYHWWAALWHSFGYDDRTSIMNSGDDVRPRHYQQFADIINNEITQCHYHPGGLSTSSLANPVAQIGISTGVLLNNPAFVIGLHIDRRVGNDAFLGLFYPHIGFDAFYNTRTNTVLAGPTTGLSLNRIAHPLYLNINTGVLFDPGTPGNRAQLNIPASVTLGLRGNGFQAGVNYTAMFDVLNSGAYSHIVGVDLSIDLP
jgi:hypothetical protein